MITEIAEFKIRPEDRSAFLEAINRAAVAFLAKSEGYLGHSVYASQDEGETFDEVATRLPDILSVRASA